MSAGPFDSSVTTALDLERLPEDGLRHELLEGEHLVSASPVPRHQYIAFELAIALRSLVASRERGLVLPGPVDVVLSESTVLVPDVAVYLGVPRERVPSRRLDVLPDLVVEVTSPSTRSRDLDIKRELYERHGIREYLVVDGERNLVEQFVRGEDGRFEPPRSHRRAVELSVLPGATVDLAAIW